VSGRVLDAGQAEGLVTAGAADLVGMTRAMIADPRLIAKVEAGTPELVRPCISINEGCRRIETSRTLACSVNPEVAHPELAEPTRPLHSTGAGMTVVVGAGPAGIEASRVLATNGLRVVLLEQDDRVGGRIDYALLADPAQVLQYRRWAERSLSDRHVEVRLGTRATTATLARMAPERVVYAGGARPLLPGWLDSPFYELRTDVGYLSGAWSPGAVGRVVVYDPEGYSAGTVVALRLARGFDGDVDLVTPLATAGHEVEQPNQVRLVKELMRSRIRVLSFTELIRTDDRKLLTRDVIRKHLTEIDPGTAVVVCGYRSPDEEQLASLRAACPDAAWHVVGDARSPGLIRHAITAGSRIAHNVVNRLSPALAR
jgi:dimethylglycine catabolism A